MSEAERLAGSVQDFLAKLQVAQWSDEGIETPCGDCNLCCTALEVTIEPDEKAALAHFRSEQLHEFQSSGAIYRNIVKAADGSCPKLVNGRCSIWVDRPRMCKRFDCRLFALADVAPPSQTLADRISSWKFSFDEEGDQQHFAAFQASLQLIAKNSETFARRGVVAGTVKAASLSIDLRHLFFDHKKTDSELLGEALMSVRGMQQQIQATKAEGS